MKITKQDAQSMIRMYEILQGDHRKEARILLHNWLLAWGRAQKLRRKGYRVSIPLHVRVILNLSSLTIIQLSTQQNIS